MNLATTEKTILSKIVEVRGVKIILDTDLSDLYQIETKTLNRSVKRNIKRFPQKYMFQLTKEEVAILRYQFGTATLSSKSRTLPYAFTEHGTLQTSSIINSDIAIEINHKIIEAFIFLRNKISTHSEYATLKEQIRRIESENSVDKKIISDKLQKVSQKVNQLSDVLNEFQSSHIVLKRPVNQGDPQQEMN